MKKKNCQEITFSSGQDSKSKSRFYEKKMPTIKCVCGFKILVVPDLKAMNRAIKNYVAEHNKSSSEKLRDFLTEQTLIVASNPA